MSSAITISAVGTAIAGYNAYEGHQNSNAAKGAMHNIQQKQDYYDSQLRSLMEDPSSFFSNPIFTSALKVGTDATAAQMAAGGFNRSSNIMKSLMDYGQGFASQQLLSQEQLLAGLTGAGQSLPGATQASTNAQGQSAMELAALSKGVGSMVGSYYGNGSGYAGADSLGEFSQYQIGWMGGGQAGHSDTDGTF